MSCAFFNPMYLSVICDECKMRVNVICANEKKNICEKCHRRPTLADPKGVSLTDKLREIEERCEKATDGPWFYDWGNWEIESRSDYSFRTSVCSMTPEDRLSCGGQEQNPVDSSDDGEFIAHARTDIPKLLKVIEKLREQRNLNSDIIALYLNAVPKDVREKDDAELLKILEGEE